LGALIWFGISVAVRDNNHVRFDLVVRGFPDKIKKYVATLGYTIFTVYLVWLAVLTVELLMQYRKLDSKTTILQISMFWIRLPILVGCVSATIRLLFKQYRILSNKEEAFAAGEHLD
jgi:TRAP-type C4-dicarboxylate transport system permease small subunit